MPQKTFIDVAVELPLHKTFTYRTPETLSNQVEIGKRVLVQFGKKVITGFCLGFSEKTDIKGIKDILDVLDDKPIFDEKRLNFFQWMSSYYFAPIGEVLSLSCPSGINIKSQRYFFATEHGIENESRVSASPRMFQSGGQGLAPAGFKQGSERPNLAGDIFDVIRKKQGASLTSLAKKFKGKSVYSAINRLKEIGIIREELKIKSRLGEKIETFVCLSQPSTLNPQLLFRAPIQAKVLAYLNEKGETSLKLLRKELGSIDSAVKKLEEKGIVSLTQKKTQRDPLDDTVPQTLSHKPNDEQEKAIKAISQALHAGAFSPFLLYGVTGSGKTFVYLKALEQAVNLGRQAIFLVPEISLTPWPIKYLTALFPQRVAVLHSGFSDGERYDECNRIKNGKVDVVVGARSALFAPLKNPGLIVVDEEHEPSYKQEEVVRYNARDVSLMMGKMFNMAVVLGSATPSIETFYNTKNGRITPLHLTKRVEDRAMPKIELIDMKIQGQGARGKGREENKNEFISEKLQNLMLKNHALGYQTILFLNRRGFSTFLICNDCGYTFMCLNCSVSLTVHKGAGILKCHYCDMSAPIPEICPKCRRSKINPIGLGTEQLEAEVRKILHKARVARMDRDTTRKKRSHQKILDAVDKGAVDVLVGTQMVAKGHHFPHVTLVGIVSADTSLNMPDFRSSERT